MYLVNSGFTKGNQPQIQEGWQIVKLTVERIRKMVLDILYYAKERDLIFQIIFPNSVLKSLKSVIIRKYLVVFGILFVYHEIR